MEWIGIIDCNNFFVSCERLFRPDLRRRPVAVLSSNDGCIVARSQEIKDSGVPMGVPHFQVKDILKDIDAVTFSSHFSLYRDLSRRVFEVVRSQLDTVEQYSIDEAFFSISGTEEEAYSVARSIKDNVEQLVGLPVSVACAPSKTIAKYANSIAKKTDGVKLLSTADWIKVTPEVKLAAVWGIGREMTKNFEKHGLRTVSDFLAVDQARIKKLFGVNGERLQAELSGIAVSKVVLSRQPQQSIMSSRSFKESTNDIAVLADAVSYHTRQIGEDLRSMGHLAAQISVSIYPSRHGDFMLQGSTIQLVLDVPCNDTITLLRITNELLEKCFKVGVPYKKAGVHVSKLTPESVKQNSLFSDNVPAREILMQVLDSVNARAGKELVSIGTHLRGVAWQSRTDKISPAYTTKWTDVVKVRA
jgi:DNA polymerase V